MVLSMTYGQCGLIMQGINQKPINVSPDAPAAVDQTPPD